MGKSNQLAQDKAELQQALTIAYAEGVYEGEGHPQAHVSKSLGKQVGGGHYKDMPLQPWEIIAKNQLDFWEGNALKYLLRYKTKNGVEDLKKAIHYIEYLIEKGDTCQE